MSLTENEIGKRRPRRRMCVCTRVHQNNADRPVDLNKVKQFVSVALKYADSIAIAVGPTPNSTPKNTDHADSDRAYHPCKSSINQESLVGVVSRAASEAKEALLSTDTTASIEDVALHVFEVTPWGKFVPALNALVGFAAGDGAELVMFQSLETMLGEDAVRVMEGHVGTDDLVVGAALTGHAFQHGKTVQLNGATTPWNTLALWNVGKLAKTGFLGVAEGLIPGVPAGVEEVTAIATLQAILGAEHARAKLVRLPQVQWETVWEDEGRRRWHESKMASKLERAERQMAVLGIKPGVVQHLEHLES